MSGFVGALFPQPIQLTRNPPPGEGPKAVPVSINWQNVYNNTGTFTQAINLLSQFQSGQFSTCQSVYIDNQTCPEMVTFTATDSGQVIRVPPFAKGMYPLFSSQSPEFTVTLNLAFDPNTGNAFSACTTRLFFLNVEQPYFEATAPNFGQNFNHYSTSFQLGGSTTAENLSGSSGGPGLIGLGNNQNYAITSLDISIVANVAYSAAGTVIFSLMEIGPPNSLLWRTVVYATTAVGALYTRQLTFPTPILQFADYSNLQFQASAVPATSGSVFVAINMTYAIVTIE